MFPLGCLWNSDHTICIVEMWKLGGQGGEVELASRS